MPEPELGPAAAQLLKAVRKGGSNILMWVMLAIVGAVPVAIQQVSSQRSDIEYLHPGNFEILGPEMAEPGTLVRLTVADRDPTDVCWFVVGDSQKYGSSGGELVFAMPKEDTTVTCAIIRRGQLYLTQKIVGVLVEPEVEPTDPEPSPEPTPEPEPVDEPLSDIGRKMADLARSGSLSVRDARKIGENLLEATKDAKNPRGLVLKTVELNEDLDLPDEVTTGIQVFLQTRAENGDMTTLEQHIDVWKQMAAGFKAYANE